MTAMLLGPLVIIHLIVILLAIKSGVTADEILGRTQGSWLWGGFYTAFVIAVSIHAPIGLRNILREWTSLAPKVCTYLSLTTALLFFILGMRAVFAVVIP